MVEIRFHPEAEDEYRAILAWYQARSTPTADRFEAEVNRAIQLVTSRPELFPSDDVGNRSVMLRRFPHRVVYRSRPDHIQVIAFAHTSQDERYWSDGI